MSIRDLLKCVIPPVLLIFYRKIRFGQSKIIIEESPLSQIEHRSDKIIIIGNGPSLKKSIEKYIDDIISNDCIAVNFFASSTLYEIVKPKTYVFADPAFFNISDIHKNSIETLFNNIIDKTCWPLRIIVPLSAKGAPSLPRLEKK